MKIRLTSAIITAILALSVVLLLNVAYTHYVSREALIANARTILDVHARNVLQQTKTLLSPLPGFTRAMHQASRGGSGAIFGHEDQVRSLFIEKLRDLPEVYSVYWADPLGQFFLVGRRLMDPHDPQTKAFFTRKVRVVDGRRQVSEAWHRPDDGSLIRESKLPDDRFDPRQRPWFIKAGTSGEPVWTDPYIFYITNKPGITFAQPVYHEGQLVAVCAADLELESLSSYLKEILPTPNSRIFVLTDQGKVIGSSDPSSMRASSDRSVNRSMALGEFGDDAIQQALQQMLSNKLEANRPGSVFKSVASPTDTFHTLVSWTRHGQLPLVVALSIPESEYFAPLANSQSSVLAVSVATMLLTLAAGLLFAKSLSRPINGLRLAAERLQSRQESMPLQEDSAILEINRTFAAFRQMQTSLREHIEETDRLNLHLTMANLDTLYRLALAAEYKDRHTASHLKRVANYSRLIAEKLQLPEADVDVLRQASPMHDVGKIGIPDEILLKPGHYTSDERRIMETHTLIGAKILADPSSEVMEMARVIALSHHERWDGTGYPAQLAGAAIPLWGRIVAVADVFDSLLSDRPYKEAFAFARALEILREAAGSHLDPDCVQIVVDHAEEFLEMAAVD